MKGSPSLTEQIIRFITWPLIAFVVFSLYINHTRAKAGRKYLNCQDNIKKISAALENYSNEHKNEYPPSLAELVSQYLDNIPACKGAGKDVYSEGYEVSKDLKTYSFYCKGQNHKDTGIEADYPRCYSKHGIIYRKKDRLNPVATPEPISSSASASKRN